MPRSVAPLVGRAGELADLLGALEGARAVTSAAAAVAVVGGDAGVGKTRLLAELVDTATTRGDLVLIGHCVDLGEAPPPYLPFSEVFARLIAEQPDLVEELLAAFPPIARLIPGRGSRSPDDRLDRGELFEAVLGALGLLAERTPVLFVVEDAHWADQATRDLLGFLFTRVRAERLAIVVSYRSDDLHRRHPLRTTLAQWARLPAVTRIQLDPLPAEHVRQLIRSIHPAPMAEPDIASIVTRADGNAFFAEELLAATEQCSDAEHLPWQLADLLLVRLDRLSDDARELVRAAAVGGRRVPHGLLADALDLSPARLDAAVRDAIDAYVLQLTPSGRGYTFRHALVAEAVYDDLLPGERVRLHAAYAAVLAERPERSRAELARHAIASHDLPTAYTASIQAGDEAMAVAAPQEALQHYETALELRSQVASDDGTGVALVVSLVDAAMAAGHTARARRLAREGLAGLADDAPGADRAQLLYTLARAAIDTESEEESMDAAADALRLTPVDPSPFRVRLTALYSRINLIRGRDVDAERWANEAIEAADVLGRSAAAAEARATLAMLQRRVSEPEDVARRIREVIEQARVDGEAVAEIRSRHNLGTLYLEQGELPAAEQAYADTWQRARELGRTWALFGMDARAMVGLVRYQRGDWDGALAAADISGEQPPGVAAARLAGIGLLVRVGRGDADAVAAADGLRKWWSQESLVANGAILAMLEAFALDGRVDDAVRLIDEAVVLLGEVWQEEWFLGRIRMSALAVMACVVAVREQSGAARAALVERAGRLVADGRATVEKGLPSGRRLGVEGVAWTARLEAEWSHLRWLAGHEAPEEGELIARWRSAIAAFDYGSTYEIARCQARLATVLRAVGQPAEAAEQVGLAREVARTLGAEPLLAEIRALGVTAAARPPAAGLDGLTDREREVLELLVEARTNRQIAARLYISEKTVSVHVSNILAKLEVRSRAEAAALARRRD